MRVAAVVLVLLAADCDPPAEPGVPAQEAQLEFHIARPQTTTERSQEGGLFRWDGSSRLQLLEMPGTTDASASVSDPDSPVLGEVCVFLDASGELRDVSGPVAPSGAFVQTLAPTLYDVLVAPDCLTGSRRAGFFEGVTLPSPLGELVWELPATELQGGEVLDPLGRPVHGAVVTLYPIESPETPLGVSMRTDANGQFALATPPGTYRMTVSAPAEGRLPDPDHTTTAPLSLQVELPLPAGFELRVRVPSLSPIRVSGTLAERTGTLTSGRVQFTGTLPPLVQPGLGEYPGGTHRAEVFSEDGTWSVELPPGNWTAESWPAHAGATPDAFSGVLPVQDQDVARAFFSLQAGQEPLTDLALSYTGSPLATVTVLEPNGDSASGTVSFWRRESPRYAYRYPLSNGQVVLPLMAGTYDVEARASLDPETRRRRYARAHGVLDLTAGPTGLVVELPRSDDYQARVLRRNEDGVDQGVGDLRVIVRDPETGLIWDDGLTAPNGLRGFFYGVLPRGADVQVFGQPPEELD